ncbi:MAG: hypothetical protein WBV55_13815 [Candidatus Sulfotelmatobacter sp.]
MKNPSDSDPKREFLRHGLATLAYRGGKAIRNTPAAFGDFSPSDGVRTPGKILAHIGDLLDWGLSIAAGKQTWKDSETLSWEKESERFFEALKRFDEYLESSEPLHATPEKLLQGPVADALTHVGQIAMLRRMAGGPVRGENYFVASVTIGCVGSEQTPPKREF